MPVSGSQWCEACRSFHPVPRDEAHHRALRCFAPWEGAIIPTTRELIAELDAAERKGTPEPWTHEFYELHQQHDVSSGDPSDARDRFSVLEELSPENADLIVLARNAARPLLDLLDQCRDELTLRHVHLGDSGESLKCYGPEMCRIAALLAQLPAKE